MHAYAYMGCMGCMGRASAKHPPTHRRALVTHERVSLRRPCAPRPARHVCMHACLQVGETFDELVGSPLYVAPEVLRRDYGKEADIWCVAACRVPACPRRACYCGRLCAAGELVQAHEQGPMSCSLPPWLMG